MISKLPYKNKAIIRCMKNKDFRNLLCKVAGSRALRIISLLFSYEIDIHIENNGRSLLHLLAMGDLKNFSGNCDHDQDLFMMYYYIVKWVLFFGFDIDSQDVDGSTALHLSYKHGNTGITLGLLRNGADINIEDNNCDTPSFCKTVSRKIRCMLQDHTLKLMLANLYVCSRNRFYNIIFTNINDVLRKQYDDVSKNCVEELDKMKNIKLDAYTSLYNILQRDENSMALHVKNKILKKIVKNCKMGDFPNYGFYIVLQYQKGLERKAILNLAKKLVTSLAGRDLPDICTENVLKFMDNNEVKNFISAMS